MVAALLSLAMATAAAAQVPGFPDSTIGADWILDPPAPCVEDGVTLWVRAFHSTPCDSFISAYRTAEDLVVVRTLTREGFACFAAPIPYGIPIAFGTLPAGGHNIVVRHRRLTLHQDGSLDSVTVDDNVAFSVSPTCTPEVPIPAHELPYVSQVFTDPAVPCPERSTALVMRGVFPSGCGRLISAGVDDNGRVNLVLAPYPPAPVPCPAVLKGWSAHVRLGFFQTGNHRVLIHQTLLGSGASWPPLLEQQHVGSFDFTVSAECETLPPPQPLPYVEFIHIGPARPDSSATLCADQPIKVSIGGTFPNGCYTLTGVQLLDLGNPIPIPPIVRLLVNDRSCDLGLCTGQPKPWETGVVLPGLPSRDYRLMVQMVKTCTDSIPPDSVFSTVVPFHVAPAESCGIQPASCLRYHWATNSTPCDATVSVEHPGFVTMTVASGVALSGLQGTLRIHEMGLQVDGVEAVGPAAGMRVSWNRTPDGARFVMFADQGAPIPATVTTPVEVLRVQVGAAPIRVAWPPAFHMSAGELLGSDIDANGVPECFIRSPLADAALPPVATICVERPCDFNADGAADVRDLVLMVRCVNQHGPCPPDPVASFDCDGDGVFALGDVLCCAVHVLRGPMCPQCPPDSVRLSNGRAELGTATTTGTGVEVRVRLSQTQELGAARIGLKFPTDRFRLASVELLNGARWLELHEDSPIGATLGLIRLQPSPEAVVGEALEAVLRLELLPGQNRGGEIRLESGDFSANDGVRLEIERGEVVRSLGPAAGLTLSRAQPNPFSGETRFSVTLESESSLEVGVFDPAGRLVRWIHRGVKGAGTHDFRWDGRTADGALAREGMYFYRVRAGGHRASGKVALLRLR